MSQSPVQSPGPGPVSRAAASWLFDRIEVDERWLTEVRALSQEGPLVYILRSRNSLDYWALEHVIRQHGLPPIGFINDQGLTFTPTRRWLGRKDKRPQAERLAAALAGGAGTAAALFLKRPPGVLEVASTSATGGRGLREGEDLLERLITLQREARSPLRLLPHAFVWTKRPDTRGAGTLDWFFGPREWPSPARVLAQFASNAGRVTLRGGQPLRLDELLSGCEGLSPRRTLNRVVYTLLRRIERERRAITGPAEKPPDRIRQEILRSHRFRSQVAKFATEDESETLRKADRMLQELQARPDGATLKALDLVLQRIFQRIYAGLDVDPKGIAQLRELCKEGSLILLPSHKSHIDYLIVSYAFYQANIPTPLIVAGDNLSFFPMGGIFRRAGAFFIRRSFKGDRLYAAVVDAYVRRLLRDGHGIELFLEGMRSRTGKLLPPKYGLLNMLVSAATSQNNRQVYFVPISIGYERIIETSSYEKELSGGDKVQEDATGLLGATRVLRHRYGRLNLQFGAPQTLEGMRAELELPEQGHLSPKQSRSVVALLANRVLDEINRVTAVTPGSLTALTLMTWEQHHSASHEQLVADCERLFLRLAARKARVSHALLEHGQLRPEAITESVQMFATGGMVELFDAGPEGGKRKHAGAGARYRVTELKRVQLATSKNMLLHFFVERALLAISWHAAPLAPSGGRCELECRRLFELLAQMLKAEFRIASAQTNLSPDGSLFDAARRKMVEDQELRAFPDSGLQAGPGGSGWSGQQWLTAYRAMLINFVEGFRILTETVHGLAPDTSLSDKELLKTSLANGRQMLESGEIGLRESISKPVTLNAIGFLLERRILRTEGGKLIVKDREALTPLLADLCRLSEGRSEA